MNDLETDYEEELEAFVIWMKDAGFTAYTRKSYLADVREFLDGLNGKRLESVKKLHVVSYLTSVRERGSVTRQGTGSMPPSTACSGR